METRAAILWEPNTPWSVETITLDPPRAGEVLVEMVASGMCHSDDHARTGDLPAITPLIGGHEGSGVVLEVGPGPLLVQAQSRLPMPLTTVHPLRSLSNGSV